MPDSLSALYTPSTGPTRTNIIWLYNLASLRNAPVVWVEGVNDPPLRVKGDHCMRVPVGATDRLGRSRAEGRFILI